MVRNKLMLNQHEIVSNVRRVATYENRWWQFGRAFVLFWLVYFIAMLTFLMITNRSGQSLTDVLLYMYVVGVLVFAARHVFRRLRIAYTWRAGMNDEQIIQYLDTQGETTQGTVTKIEDGIVHFDYETSDELRLSGTFETKRWRDYAVGDEMTVLYVHNTVAVLMRK